eukprot:6460124-Amphidinium_carterae.1
MVSKALSFRSSMPSDHYLVKNSEVLLRPHLQLLRRNQTQLPNLRQFLLPLHHRQNLLTLRRSSLKVKQTLMSQSLRRKKFYEHLLKLVKMSLSRKKRRLRRGRKNENVKNEKRLRQRRRRKFMSGSTRLPP